MPSTYMHVVEAPTDANVSVVAVAVWTDDVASHIGMAQVMSGQDRSSPSTFSGIGDS